MKTTILTTAAFILGLTVGYFLQPDPQVTVKQSGEWIQVEHDGTVTGEWRAQDGEPYRILRQLIDGGLDPARGQGTARMI